MKTWMWIAIAAIVFFGIGYYTSNCVEKNKKTTNGATSGKPVVKTMDSTTVEKTTVSNAA